ncbi:hypothetical protein C8Q77DRAFT_1154323 [Trametes polyzona]|nr:hypothetical protein C8Q77DRAFT_1154323 [Trametes polyzona]
MDVSLSHMLIRDGSIYFGVLLGLNVLHVASALTTAFSGSIAYYEEPLVAIIISRIMLNLREADKYARGSGDSGGEGNSGFSVFQAGFGHSEAQAENEVAAPSLLGGTVDQYEIVELLRA